MKTFAYAGTTHFNNETKVRFCNDLDQRLEILGKGGHTAMNFVELTQPMEKFDAVMFLKDHEDFQGETEQEAINTAIIRRNRAKAIELGLVEVKKPGRKAKAKVESDGTPQFDDEDDDITEANTETADVSETVSEVPAEAAETVIPPEELIMAQPLRDANGMFLSRDKRIALARAQMLAEAAETETEENAEMA